MGEEESDALLQWLLEGAHETEGDDAAALAAEWLTEANSEQSETPTAEDALREIGYNRIEREEFFRSTTPRGSRSANARHAETQMKRYLWHIKNRVHAWPADSNTPEHAAAVWYELTSGALEMAQQWWDAGVPPQDLELITALIQYGLTPRDLARNIGGYSIIQHLSRGNSLRWCMLATGWAG